MWLLIRDLTSTAGMDKRLHSTILCACYCLSNAYPTYIGIVAETLSKHHGIWPMLAFDTSERNLLQFELDSGIQKKNCRALVLPLLLFGAS